MKNTDLRPCDTLITNITVASMQQTDDSYGIMTDATVAIDNGVFVYVGSANDCPYTHSNPIDGQQQWLLPGLIDCHTHMVHGGNRAKEFEMRLQGVSYAEIARQGGGIQSTVNATRDASATELLVSALGRAKRLMQEGVTCVEIKSGYGLDQETELKMLQVAKQVGQQLPINVCTTYLGAHAVPTEYQNNRQGYLDLVCEQVMPMVAEQQLADAVDVFCESIGFSLAESERVFTTAKRLGLPVKAHVEQLSDMGGAMLACRHQALSVDHIEYLSTQDIPALAASDTVAVILPGAFYYLNEQQKPPIQALRDNGVAMAVATDMNPGSSPVVSLLTAMNMACVLFSMTPVEALKGVTVHAAKALGISKKGVIKTGYDADFGLWPIQHPSELAYGINTVQPSQLWIGGEHVNMA